MKRMRVSILCLVAGLLVAASCLLGCGGQELVSTWCESEVTVDGLDTEWEGAMAYLDDPGVAIGLLNDAEYLYLCLATVDSRVVRQVVGSGLTVWFDPQGGKKEVFGINFPVVMDPSSMSKPGENRSMSEPGEGGPDPERIRQMLEKSAYEMIIMGPEKNQSRRMPVAGSQQVKVMLSYHGGKLIYELRVPLRRDLERPDAIGLQDDDTIGLGFETAEIDREAMKERMKNRMGSSGPPAGDGMGGGGMRGGGMRGGGMRGGRGPGGGDSGGELPEQLQLWAKVLLASAESATLTSSSP
jgi:hypothetical protein